MSGRDNMLLGGRDKREKSSKYVVVVLERRDQDDHGR